MMIEDTDSKLLVNIYAWCLISGLLSVFFAPVASLLVGRLSVVPAMRIIYAFAFVSMTLKFVILYVFSRETTRGMQRMEETRNSSMFSMFGELRGIIVKIIKTPKTLQLLGILILFSISSVVLNNFFGVYITQRLGIDEALVAYFPMIRAAIMLVFMFVLQPRLNALPYRPTIIIGALLYIAGMLSLLAASFYAQYVFLFVYVVCEALGFALFMPRRDSLLVLFVDPDERARTVSLINMAVLAITSPFAYLAGVLSEIDKILPFMLNIVLYALIILLVASSKIIKKHDRGE